MKYKAHKLETPIENDLFELHNLVIESSKLAKNLLKDSAKKHNYVLVPKKSGEWPLVVHLSGYFGNGVQNFNVKTFEDNFPQAIIKATQTKKAPLAVHVFVDGMTGVGGSQFINSEVCGAYSDYIQIELMEALKKTYSLSKSAEHFCLFGASSGGYGSLHHISQVKSPFGVAVAIAPDSHFESSLLPDYYKMAPFLKEYTTLEKIKKALHDGSLKKNKNYFHVMNCLAMTLCYLPLQKGQLQFPIDLLSGERNEKLIELLQQKDPVHFLNQKAKELKDKMIYLDVGRYDEFCLYFGARKIQDLLKKNKTPHMYEEFEGGHFSLLERKLKALEWLKEQWTGHTR